VGKIPKDSDARSAFLEEWARGQRSRLFVKEKQRREAEQLARVLTEARQRAAEVDSLVGVAVIPVVITKPSDLPVDRAAVFADLTVGLREYKWADPIVSECDEPRYVAPKAIDLARTHGPDAPWFLYMQDDVVLGPDFGLLPELLREADELFPHAGIVSFFHGPWIEPGWSTHRMELFGWLQCAAIRNTDHLAGFGTFVDDLVAQSPVKESTLSATRPDLPTSQQTRPRPYSDRAVGTFLATEYDVFALWCPSLVQHADVESTFSGPQLKRPSWSYRLAYG
jgi:hypothetical protein